MSCSRQTTQGRDPQVRQDRQPCTKQHRRPLYTFTTRSISCRNRTPLSPCSLPNSFVAGHNLSTWFEGAQGPRLKPLTKGTPNRQKPTPSNVLYSCRVRIRDPVTATNYPIVPILRTRSRMHAHTSLTLIAASRVEARDYGVDGPDQDSQRMSDDGPPRGWGKKREVRPSLPKQARLKNIQDFLLRHFRNTCSHKAP